MVAITTGAIAQVWFCDRAGTWYFLAKNFMRYFRLLVLHLGLPNWQYLYTDAGLSPSSEQWFRLYAPLRLAMTRSHRYAQGAGWPRQSAALPSGGL